MLATKRHEKILSDIKKNGSILVTKISEELSVSIETIRRDLMELENKNLLRRVHGGAVGVNNNMFTFLNLEERKEDHKNEKIKLSKTASHFVKDGDVIYIDTGSTAIRFAEQIKDKKITVVTCSLEVFDVLRYSPSVEVILCGGYFLPSEKVFYGGLALDTLSKIHVSKSFIFVSAVSLVNGICDYEKNIYELQKKGVEIGDEVFILADSNKFEKNGLLKISDMKKEFVYVTDNELKEEYKKLYLKNGFNIVTCREDI